MRRTSTVVFSMFLWAACGDDGSGGFDGGPGGPDGGGVGTDGGFWPLNDAGQPLCENDAGEIVVCECSDGVDNDMDGMTDAGDIECAGPFDNDESSFATGIPGDNSDPWVNDCFFDGDSGGGNDGCRWDTRCLDVMAPYEGEHCNNQQLDGCGNCRNLTPNGCDCFGCCDVYVDTDGDGVGEPHRVRIIDTCDPAVIDDPVLCPPCEFVVECSNPCDPCEYCIGHVPDPGCTEGPCADGVVECDVDGACPDMYGCVSGCCQPIIE